MRLGASTTAFGNDLFSVRLLFFKSCNARPRVLPRRKPSRDHDFDLRSSNARLRQRKDCSPPQVGRSAA
jgi:hypothetical protein